MSPDDTSGVSMQETYSAIEGKLDNCGYLDKRTIEGALGAVVDWAMENGVSADALRSMFVARMAGAPYPPRPVADE